MNRDSKLMHDLLKFVRHKLESWIEPGRPISVKNLDKALSIAFDNILKGTASGNLADTHMMVNK